MSYNPDKKQGKPSRDWKDKREQKRNQGGFTVVELMILIATLTGFAGFFGVVYVVSHFISKFW